MIEAVNTVGKLLVLVNENTLLKPAAFPPPITAFSAIQESTGRPVRVIA